LTEDDRARLGGDLETCWRRLGTAGIWIELCGVSVERAVVEVALSLGYSDDPTAKWLLREIGEEQVQPPTGRLPVWNRDRGELRWGRRVIRRVRVMSRPSSIQKVLDTFQAAGWPTRILDPISKGKNAEQLRQIVHSLNTGLAVICFHVQEAGRAITWAIR
jgi:hypothetical protein